MSRILDTKNIHIPQDPHIVYAECDTIIGNRGNNVDVIIIQTSAFGNKSDSIAAMFNEKCLFYAAIPIFNNIGNIFLFLEKMESHGDTLTISCSTECNDYRMTDILDILNNNKWNISLNLNDATESYAFIIFRKKL